MMETVWIMGAGRFGRLAASRLAGAYRIIMVDASEKQLEKVTHPGVHCRYQDGVQYLDEHLFPDTDAAWIIPCLPVHLAWEWCCKKLGSRRLISHTVDRDIKAVLPNPIQSCTTHIYVSHADFVCPDNCSEPDTICTKTGQPRKKPMYSLLESMHFKDYKPLVIRSHQIGPGVGGYSPGQLYQLLTDIKNAENKILVSTACKCHGVMTGGRVLNPDTN